MLRPRALIHTCGIGGGRVGFVTKAAFASGTYSSSSMTPAFVAHLMRGGADLSGVVLATSARERAASRRIVLRLAA